MIEANARFATLTAVTDSEVLALANERQNSALQGELEQSKQDAQGVQVRSIVTRSSHARVGGTRRPQCCHYAELRILHQPRRAPETERLANRGSTRLARVRARTDRSRTSRSC